MFNKIKFNKILFSILLFIISGILIGIFSTNKLDKLDILIIDKDLSFLKIFLNAFTLNYWYFFIIWFIGLIPFGFIFSYLITFIKSFTIGVTLGICLKGSAIFGIKEFITFTSLEIIIIIPTLIYATYQSIKISLNTDNQKNKYINVLYKITIFIIIYAILTCLKMTFLEVK